MKALKPSPKLLVKLGSLIVHAEEAMGENGHQFDYEAFSGLLDDPEVDAWLKEMDDAVLLPKKRT